MSRLLSDLEPVTRALCEAFLADCLAAGEPVGITHTLRTMDEQAHQYAKGRTIEGEPCHHSDGVRRVGTCQQHPLGATVTRAKPGQSPHNYGMAFDIKFLVGGPYPDVVLEADRWLRIGRIGERLGLSWGGPLGELDRFTWDRPHFERADWKAAVAAKGAAA